jgi:hypothetical protein
MQQQSQAVRWNLQAEREGCNKWATFMVALVHHGAGPIPRRSSRSSQHRDTCPTARA